MTGKGKSPQLSPDMALFFYGVTAFLIVFVGVMLFAFYEISRMH